MRTIERARAFKRDYKRLKLSVRNLDDLLGPVVTMLATDTPLPEKHRDHALIGNWKGHRECHIKPDLLLIYRKPEESLRLDRLGSHSDLFE